MTYEEALQIAYTSQKYGAQVDIEGMTEEELISWAERGELCVRFFTTRL